MIKAGDMLYDCYPDEGIYTTILVKERVKSGQFADYWMCDLMQVVCSADFVTAGKDFKFTERYLYSLSSDPY